MKTEQHTLDVDMYRIEVDAYITLAKKIDCGGDDIDEFYFLEDFFITECFDEQNGCFIETPDYIEKMVKQKLEDYYEGI